MSLQETTPELLAVGDTILGGDGREWVIVDLTPDMVTMERNDKRHEVPRDRLPAKLPLVESRAQAEERAVALAQVRLGGEVVGVRDGGPYVCPDAFPDTGSMLAHLYLFHQAPRDPKAPAVYPAGPMAELVKAHDEHHRGALVVPHRHSSAFYGRPSGPRGF